MGNCIIVIAHALYSPQLHLIMERELQLQLANVLKIIVDNVSAATDFSLSQLPDIAQEYIAYGFWSGLLGVIIPGAIVFFLIAAWISFGVYLHKIDYVTSYNTMDAEGAAFILFLFSILVIIGCFFLLWGHVNELILNISAPKMWFLIKIKDLLS